MSKRASETREQTLHMQARTRDKHKHSACAEGSAVHCIFYRSVRVDAADLHADHDLLLSELQNN